MTEDEHLLTIVAEESTEIIEIAALLGKRATKALRFGLEDVEPGQLAANAERLVAEFDDLQGVVRMLQERGLLPASDEARIRAKQDKVAGFMEYSERRGRLVRPAPSGLTET